ncbi:retrovirus-related pol polyprotein LINE-1, partial [Tanacetum coccineum]
SLTSKLLELSGALGRHKVDIAFFHETKWKRSRAREGNGYKLWYSGSGMARNGMGVMVAGRLKDDVVRVTRRSDRIMAISVVIDGEAVNVISAYAPQVGLSDAEKKRFWDALDELVRECLADERLIIRGDLNGHIGAATDGYEGVHGGFGFGDRNEEGRGLKECRDCKAFLGETCSSRHRLIIVDVLFERKQHRREREATRRPRILWKNLKGEEIETFRATVSDKLSGLEEDMYAHNVDHRWNTFAGVIRDVAKDSLEDIDLAKERYKVAKREAKIVVARAKDKAYEDLYKKLDSKEGANDIYKIAKARERKRQDIGNVRYIKDEGGRTIMREEDIRKR